MFKAVLSPFIRLSRSRPINPKVIRAFLREGFVMGKRPTGARAPVQRRAAAKKGAPRSAAKPTPLRFAHPFFTTTPRPEREKSLATGTKNLADYASAKLGPIPAPTRTPTMDLKDIISQQGVDDIQTAGAIRFHAVGDTGRSSGVDAAQEQVSDAMSSDYDASAGGHNPALLIHLGDVIYGQDKGNKYRDEFYRPYMKYPGKIVAIPGNHDGEVYKGSDPVSLKAFLDNFCSASAVVPPIAGDVRIFRQTMTQPGVYWLLTCPFVNFMGLYSNIAEGPGNLLGEKSDNKQIKWLTSTLASLKGDKRALVIATHHPPYSSGGHSSSKDMLAQIDKACNDAGAVPHAMLAGHSHNYQRYTRATTLAGKDVQIPYIVAGCGGHIDSSVDSAHGQKIGQAEFEKSMKGFGYLLLTASATQLTIAMFATNGGPKMPFDTVTVDIASRRVVEVANEF